MKNSPLFMLATIVATGLKQTKLIINEVRSTSGGAFILNNEWLVRGTNAYDVGLFHPSQLYGKTVTIVHPANPKPFEEGVDINLQDTTQNGFVKCKLLPFAQDIETVEMAAVYGRTADIFSDMRAKRRERNASLPGFGTSTTRVRNAGQIPSGSTPIVTPETETEEENDDNNDISEEELAQLKAKAAAAKKAKKAARQTSPA